MANPINLYNKAKENAIKVDSLKKITIGQHDVPTGKLYRKIILTQEQGSYVFKKPIDVFDLNTTTIAVLEKLTVTYEFKNFTPQMIPTVNVVARFFTSTGEDIVFDDNFKFDISNSYLWTVSETTFKLDCSFEGLVVKKDNETVVLPLYVRFYLLLMNKLEFAANQQSKG